MKLINDWGEILKLTDKNYRRYLIDLATGNDISPRSPKYEAKSLGIITFTSTEAGMQEGIDALELIGGPK